MNERTERFPAQRQFRPKRGDAGSAVLLYVIGGILVVAALIAVLGFVTGFFGRSGKSPMTNASDRKTAGRYCLLFRSDKRVFSPEEAEQAVEQVKSCGGKDAQPVLLASVLYQYQAGTRQGFFFPKILAGFDPDADASAFGLKHMVKEGEYSLERGEIGIGQTLADVFGLKVGDKVVLHSPGRLSKLFERDPGNSGRFRVVQEKTEYYIPGEYTVSFIFSSGGHDFDRDIIFMSLYDADDLFGLEWDSATHVCVRLDPTLHLDDFKGRILQNDSQKGLRFVSEMPTKEEDRIKQDLIIMNPGYAFLQRLTRLYAGERPATQN